MLSWLFGWLFLLALGPLRGSSKALKALEASKEAIRKAEIHRAEATTPSGVLPGGESGLAGGRGKGGALGKSMFLWVF